MRSERAAGSYLLWFGVLGAPVAWTTQLILSYSLEEWFACSPGTSDRGEILGFGVPDVAVVISALLTTVAVAAGLVAVNCYRKLRGGPDDETRVRARWMAIAGIMNSVLYLIILIASFAPPFVLGVCETAP